MVWNGIELIKKANKVFWKFGCPISCTVCDTLLAHSEELCENRYRYLSSTKLEFKSAYFSESKFSGHVRFLEIMCPRCEAIFSVVPLFAMKEFEEYQKSLNLPKIQTAEEKIEEELAPLTTSLRDE